MPAEIWLMAARLDFTPFATVTLGSWMGFAWLALKHETLPRWALPATGIAAGAITAITLFVGVAQFARSLAC